MWTQIEIHSDDDDAVELSNKLLWIGNHIIHLNPVNNQHVFFCDDFCNLAEGMKTQSILKPYQKP